jgi:hypothetical protein
MQFISPQVAAYLARLLTFGCLSGTCGKKRSRWFFTSQMYFMQACSRQRWSGLCIILPKLYYLNTGIKDAMLSEIFTFILILK